MPPPGNRHCRRPSRGRRRVPHPIAARRIRARWPLTLSTWASRRKRSPSLLEKHRGGGRDAEESILKWLLAEQTGQEKISSSSEDFDMTEFETEDEVRSEELSEKDRKFLTLVEMGFTEDEASSAIDICGQQESVLVLADAICAAQLAKRDLRSGGESVAVEFAATEVMDIGTSRGTKRKIADPSGSGSMVEFSLPNEVNMHNRKLPDIADGPPYFYFENDKMSRSLYGIEPEFVDWKYFCAVTRRIGYVHNLPLYGRFPILPMQQKTIQDAFPLTRESWPCWDTRTHLNGVQIMRSHTRSATKVIKMLTDCGGTPTGGLRKKIIDECRNGNLIWVGRNKVAVVDLFEWEALMGYPRDHTRGFSMTDRYRSLQNTFQVDTVAYHLSVLKALFPDGIRVLSLFSSIGGAEVALNRLKLHIKVLVSVEILEMNRVILKTWWEESKQTGELIQIENVQSVTNHKLETWVITFGGFDLVVRGNSCNNVYGGNNPSRIGPEEEQSELFCVRVLQQLRQIMRML